MSDKKEIKIEDIVKSAFEEKELTAYGIKGSNGELEITSFGGE